MEWVFLFLFTLAVSCMILMPICHFYEKWAKEYKEMYGDDENNDKDHLM